jgi:methyl-accepting chemotaxis protein
MGFIQNLSFKSKLLLIAIPPLLGIIFYSIIFISSLLSEKSNLEATKNQIQEIEVLSKIVHFMQLERGLSLGFISSNGSKNSDKISNARQNISKALEEIKSISTEIKSSDKLLSILSELSKIRTQVDTLQISIPEVATYYTKAIGSILNITTIIPNIIDDQDSRNIIQAYTHLSTMEEQLGQIRANLNVAFINNSFPENAYFNFAVSLGALNMNKNKFLIIAPEQIVNYFTNNFKGDSIDKTFSMMDIAKVKGINGKFEMDPLVWFSNASTTIDALKNIEEKLYEHAAIGIQNKIDNINNEIFIIFTIIVLLLIVEIIILYVVIRNTLSSLDKFKDGLFSFFSYLNRESSNVQLVKLDSQDEFGEMAKVVNTNIQKTQKGIEEDRKLIDETINVLSEFEQGDLCQRLNANVSNPALMQLKNVLNQMANNLETNIDNILNILEQYAHYNYLNKIPTNNIKEHLLKLATGVNTLGDSITQMLVENKANGLTLDESSNILLLNVNKLNTSSNEAAASLEETAAALEEITSNIRNTTSNIAKMSTLSSSVTKSSTNGEKLANKTTIAMEEINVQVNSINEAISVIDQIAFQTNILSLNAAVEAATAGEAGKGFAVVAQEVRNLASRSAEAAKEIKNIVENAKNKADEGKEIASHMISGYKELNENIRQTTNLISDIEMSSKEQLTGIEQINDAVNQLDQQTQQNAQIASQTHDIAVLTDEIAKLVVSDADTKEFIGKKEVKAKSLNTKNNHSNNYIAPKNDFIKTTTTKVAAKTITPSNNNDEWESF